MLRYAITARNLLPGDELQRQAELIRIASHHAQTGVNFLQIREKDLPAKSLTHLARQIIAATRATASPIKILINSRADIAIATAADGVHLTASPHELTPTQIRQLYAAANLPTPIITISCHTLASVVLASRYPKALALGLSRGEERWGFSPWGMPLEEATRAKTQTVDAILFGPVFEKSIANQTITPGTGLDLLAEACAAANPIPVLALGGITTQNTEACLQAGAAGIAAIRLFLLSADGSVLEELM